MDWFWNAFWAWFGWNIAAPLALLIALGIVVLLLSIPRFIRQMRCPHQAVRETMACQAICLKCGKDLGFIGTWREQASLSPASKQEAR